MDVDGLIGLLGSGEACSEFELSVRDSSCRSGPNVFGFSTST